jgi:4a-hydroxytetrahydrobiopterin dehydratase
MTKLSDEEVRGALAEGLAGWSYLDNALRRELRFASFREAIGFVHDVAEAAEAAHHHPDLHISYRSVTVTLSKHSEGGVTAKDVALARTIDGLSDRGV